MIGKCINKKLLGNALIKKSSRGIVAVHSFKDPGDILDQSGIFWKG